MSHVLTELQDPATSPQRLHAISVEAPEYAALISRHPNAYPELVAWAEEYQRRHPSPSPATPPATGLSRKVLVTLSAVGAGVLAVGALTIWALVRGGAAPETTVPSTQPTPTVMTTPPTTPSAEPVLVFEDKQFDPDLWIPQGNLLVHEELQFGHDSTSIIHLHHPGGLEASINVANLFPGQEVLHTRWSVFGNEEPGLAVAASIRTPAAGITPETFHVEVVGIGTDQTELGRARVLDGHPSEIQIRQMVGSYGTGIAIEVESGDFYGDDYLRETHGVDARGGTGIWREPSHIATYVFGAVTFSRGFYEIPPDINYCEHLVSLDITTGTALWSIDATEEERVRSRCADIEILQDYHGSHVNTWEAMHDALVLVTVETSNESEFRLFEARTGAPLQPLARKMPLFDSVQGLALRDNRGLRAASDPVTVYDVHTGETIYEMQLDEAIRLDLRPQQLFDGVLYAETTDEHIAIELASGELTDTAWSRYPIAQIGDWVYHNDGLLVHRQ